MIIHNKIIYWDLLKRKYHLKKIILIIIILNESNIELKLKFKNFYFQVFETIKKIKRLKN